MKAEILNAYINTPCYNCGKRDYLITKERDEAGYQRAICKSCNFVMLKFSDNGTSIDIEMPNRPPYAKNK